VDENNNLAGYGISDQSGRAGLSIWGDDTATDEDEGLGFGEAFYVLIPELAGSEFIAIDWLEGTGSYSLDGISVGRLSQNLLMPDRAEISASPNPFNDMVTIRYNRLSSAPVALTLYDISGRELARQVLKSTSKRKIELITISAESLPSGVIFIRVEQGGIVSTTKAVHLP